VDLCRLPAPPPPALHRFHPLPPLQPFQHTHNPPTPPPHPHNPSHTGLVATGRIDSYRDGAAAPMAVKVPHETPGQDPEGGSEVDFPMSPEASLASLGEGSQRNSIAGGDDPVRHSGDTVTSGRGTGAGGRIGWLAPSQLHAHGQPVIVDGCTALATPCCLYITDC
jgi:hypothetical protein